MIDIKQLILFGNYDFKYLSQQQCKTVMNLNKIKLPPSPRSHHARKPLYNLQNIQTSSLQRFKQKNKPEIQKNQSFGSSDKEKKKIFQQHQINAIKQNIQKQQKSMMQKNIESEKRCKSHKDRRAVNFIQRTVIEYYCFECSLHQARRGIKLTPIATKVRQIQNSKQMRKNEIRFFIQKAQLAASNIRQNMSQKNELIRQLNSKCTQLISNQKNKFEEIIKNAEKQHLKNMQIINSFKQQQLTIINQSYNNLERKCSIIINSKRDVLKNYEDCIQEFAVHQFRQIMQKYWDCIKESYEIVGNQKRKDNQIIHKLVTFIDLLNESEQFKNNSNQFTFSKQTMFETPKSSSKLSGVKLISSNFVSGNQNKYQNNYIVQRQNPQNFST